MKRFKRLIQITIVAALAASMTIPVLADTQSDLNNANALQEQLQQQAADSQAKLDELQNSKADLEEKIAEIDAQISDADALISAYSSQAAEKQDEIDTMNDEIDDKYAAMKLRIQYMYENLQFDYVSTLLNSDSLGEFFQKVEYIMDINTYDREMMAEIEEMKTEVEAELADVEALNAAQQEQEAVLYNLEEMRYSELADTEAEIADEMSELEAINADLEANAAAIEELSAQFDAEQAAASSSSGGGDYSYSGGTGVATGSWIWPLPSGYTYVSSGYGYRDGGFHAGIDIPAPEGTPVYAVDGGVVAMARWSPYADTGNYIVIYHGNGVYSEYMHLSDIYVSYGQTVSQGQTIGAVGNTGDSYGSHLHIAEGIGASYWLNRVAPPYSY